MYTEDDLNRVFDDIDQTLNSSHLVGPRPAAACLRSGMSSNMFWIVATYRGGRSQWEIATGQIEAVG